MLLIVRTKIDSETRKKIAEDLWGAGLDLEAGGMDFGSLINLRQTQNRSREILNEGIRKQAASLIESLLKD